MAHTRFVIASLASLAISLPVAAQSVPTAGQIAVSEIMFNPGPDACVTDAAGEWFEVVNVSNVVLDLNGVSFEDRNTTTGNPSGFGFTVKPSVATLPPLYPGQSFVFARSNAAGNLPAPAAYAYAVAAGGPPADGSQVGSTGMMLNNTGVDGMFVATGGLASAGGTIIETVSYNASAAPISTNVGVSAERINLLAPWAVSGAANDNNNVAQPGAAVTFGACSPTQRGTPGALNANDNTLFPNYAIYNSGVATNTGVLTPKGSVSIGAGGLIQLTMSSGPASTGYQLGYAAAAGDLAMSTFGPFTGALLLDLATVNGIASSTPFDGAGLASMSITLPNDPTIIGVTVYLQWLTFDISLLDFVLSNGVSMLICP